MAAVFLALLTALGALQVLRTTIGIRARAGGRLSRVFHTLVLVGLYLLLAQSDLLARSPQLILGLMGLYSLLLMVDIGLSRTQGSGWAGLVHLIMLVLLGATLMAFLPLMNRPDLNEFPPAQAPVMLFAAGAVLASGLSRGLPRSEVGADRAAA